MKKSPKFVIWLRSLKRKSINVSEDLLKGACLRRADATIIVAFTNIRGLLVTVSSTGKNIENAGGMSGGSPLGPFLRQVCCPEEPLWYNVLSKGSLFAKDSVCSFLENIKNGTFEGPFKELCHAML
jgi:hypothetical protein